MTLTLEETLNKYGVAIIPNVLTYQECNTVLSEMWDFFEHITSNWQVPLNRNDKLTWKKFYDLYPMHSMLFQHFSIGHAQAVWNLRQNLKIIEPFAKYWNCNPEDLLVSFDGSSFSLPPEDTNRGWHRKNWMHTDQSYLRNGKECIQSWFTPLDVDEGDGTLAFYEGSHLLHEEFAKEFEIKEKNDWFQLKENEHELFYSSKCNLKRIKCKKGSMVFWDSRLIHCGNEPIKGRKNPKQRCAIYLCYQPRKFARSHNIEKKRKAFNDLRTTSHWPCKVKLFSKKPRTWGGELKETVPIEAPSVSDIGKKIAGF